MGRRIVPEAIFWILHLGCFLAAAPIIFLELSGGSSTSRRNLSKILFKSSPDWMRYLVYAFAFYAFVSFLHYVVNGVASGNQPRPLGEADWRGFSGHWMAAYSGALAVLWSAAHLDESA